MKERIKALCRQKGVSLNQAEIDLGFGKGYLSKLGATKPNGSKLQQLADYFGVTVEYLMTGQQQSTPGLSDETLDIAYYIEQNPDFKTFVEVAKRSDRRQLDILREYMEKLNALEGVRG